MYIGNYIAYSCVIGSRAYGLNRPDSDYDRRGFYILPARLHWAISTPKGAREQVQFSQRAGDDAVYWEVEKFVRLLLSGNPNMLECLFTPMREVESIFVKPLLLHKEAFLSQKLINTYGGYARQQFEKLRANKDACEELGLAPKQYNNPGCVQGTRDIALSRRNAMHMVRMMLSGITALRDHYILVDVSDYREDLLNIRNGIMSLRDAYNWYLELEKEFQHWKVHTTLPVSPDIAFADKYMINIRSQFATENATGIYYGSSEAQKAFESWKKEVFNPMQTLQEMFADTEVD